MDNHIDGSDDNNHMITSYYPITIYVWLYIEDIVMVITMLSLSTMIVWLYIGSDDNIHMIII